MENLSLADWILIILMFIALTSVAWAARCMKKEDTQFGQDK